MDWFYFPSSPLDVSRSQRQVGKAEEVRVSKVLVNKAHSERERGSCRKNPSCGDDFMLCCSLGYVMLG